MPVLSRVGRWPTGTLMHRLSESERKELLDLGTRQRIRPGTVLLRAGETGTAAILILHTFVKVSVPTPSGHEALLSVRVPGDLVGEIAVLNDQPRTATAVSCGPGLVSVIPSARLKEFMSSRPGVTIQLAGMVADRLRWSNERRVDAAAYPATIRLARVLSEMAMRHGVRTPRGIEIGVLLTQSELAALVGVSAVTVQRALRLFRDRGLIATGYRRFLVTEPGRLRAAADVPLD